MSKMAEMAQTIEELRTAAASINAAADWLYQIGRASCRERVCLYV